MGYILGDGGKVSDWISLADVAECLLRNSGYSDKGEDDPQSRFYRRAVSQLEGSEVKLRQLKYLDKLPLDEQKDRAKDDPVLLGRWKVDLLLATVAEMRRPDIADVDAQVAENLAASPLSFVLVNAAVAHQILDEDLRAPFFTPALAG